MSTKPEDLERARKVLRIAQHHTLSKLVEFVVDHEDEILASTGADFDSSGVMERLTGIHQELFMLGGLIATLPAPAAPVARPQKPSQATGNNESA
ncbi:hypothetical protein HY251_19115 [bacterium]|nr:hypothetical protein [bacterium]